MTMPFSPRNTPPLTLRGSIFVAQRVEGVAGEQVADAGETRSGPSPARRYSAICRAVPSAVFKRDVAGEPLGDHDIDRALADVVALDEAEIFEARQVGVPQELAGARALAPRP